MKCAAFSRFLAFVGVLAGVVSCGGGGTDLAGIGGTGITSGGTITGFGSVFVNGVKYEVGNDTSITVDGVSKTQNDLRVGMVVTVKGTIKADGATGTATSIAFRDEVKGPVANLDPLTCQQFEVLGLLITVDRMTLFRDSTGAVITCANLADGNVVEVSGFRIDDATVRATHVERKAVSAGVSTPVEIKGRVQDRNDQTLSFRIKPTLIVNFPSWLSDAFDDEDFVKVEGTLKLDGTLQATSIEVVEEGFSADPGNDVELEGIVIGFDSATGRFSISGQPVQLTAQTTFEYGAREDLSMPTVRVEVEGAIDNGVLIAKKVVMRREAPYEIKGAVHAVSAGTITIVGLGRDITVNNLTQFEDERDRSSPFGLGNIRIDDYVEVDAFLDTQSNNIVATRVERETTEQEVELEGPVDRGSINGSGFTFKILGITVITTSSTTFEQDGTVILKREDFFAALTDDSVVSVSGEKFDNGSIVADEIELEE